MGAAACSRKASLRSWLSADSGLRANVITHLRGQSGKAPGATDVWAVGDAISVNSVTVPGRASHVLDIAGLRNANRRQIL